MYIHQVVRGTEFTFTFAEDDVVEGIFDGNIDHMQFYIVSPAISRNYAEYHEAEPTVSFTVADKAYSFTAKLLKISDQKEAINEALEFRVVSPIKEEPLRKNFRLEVALKVRLHEYTDDYTKLHSNGWVCDAVSVDMSKSGIRLFSDYALDAKIGDIYTLEFALGKDKIYMIPARLVRNKVNTTTRTYAYDIGFGFNYEGADPTKHEKLMMDLLEYKIQHRV
ncbi:MAG: PilZ domain-containing protein [Defluviitaleaceae bacterium]|nr:PilZ domain-containing protein [Defluviitaleaceae bacterium]MCL2263418.1 PilZ domain-containing protein [Defluviitaleaceae bacterium]